MGKRVRVKVRVRSKGRVTGEDKGDGMEWGATNRVRTRVMESASARVRWRLRARAECWCRCEGKMVVWGGVWDSQRKGTAADRYGWWYWEMEGIVR